MQPKNRKAGTIKASTTDELIKGLIGSLERSPEQIGKYINAIVMRSAQNAQVPKESYMKLAAYMKKSKLMTVETDNVKFLSTGEAAKKLGVSDQTIINWIKAGKMRAEKTLGGQNRVYADQFKTTAEQDRAFDEFLAEMDKKYAHLGPVDEDDLSGI